MPWASLVLFCVTNTVWAAYKLEWRRQSGVTTSTGHKIYSIFFSFFDKCRLLSWKRYESGPLFLLITNSRAAHRPCDIRRPRVKVIECHMVDGLEWPWKEGHKRPNFSGGSLHLCSHTVLTTSDQTRHASVNAETHMVRDHQGVSHSRPKEAGASALPIFLGTPVCVRPHCLT